MRSEEVPSAEVGEPTMAKSLSIHANEYKPTSTPVPSAKSNSVKPVKTRDLFETLDYVPFTPSQGICTPSPSNVAAMWMARRCDLTSDGSSLSSMASSDYGAGHVFVPAGAMYPVYAPMPYSPGAPHPMFAPAIPSPHHHHIHGPPPGAAAFFAAPSPMAGNGAFVGSPAPGGLTPGRSIFAKYLLQEGYGSEPSNSPQNSASDGSSAPSSGQKSDKSLSQRNVSPGALEAAISWCADKGLTTTEPPQATIELASLALAYGIDLEAAADLAAAAATTGPSTASSPVKQPSSRQDNKSINNCIRLNARQRRTLRRALDRALAALENGEENTTITTIMTITTGGGLGPQQQAKNQQQQQQQATYKTPMKTNNNYNNNDEENEYLQMTPSGAIKHHKNYNVAPPPPPPPPPSSSSSQGMVFGSPVFMHPQTHHPHVPMHMQMGFHAVAAAAAENAMVQISMAQQHHVHAQVAAGYMGPMPMSPYSQHSHHHMMAPAMYHQDQQQQQMQQQQQGQGAARGKMNRNQTRFAPKVAAAAAK